MQNNLDIIIERFVRDKQTFDTRKVWTKLMKMGGEQSKLSYLSIKRLTNETVQSKFSDRYKFELLPIGGDNYDFIYYPIVKNFKSKVGYYLLKYLGNTFGT